ncbi:MAG: Coq4 family protein [Pseudomonadota bacterium]
MMHLESDAPVPPEQIQWINGFPAPPAPPVQPLHGLASVFRLIRNKEDTRQVFEVVRALAGDSGARNFERFTSTDYGRRVVSEPIKLEELLSDKPRLRAMGPGTLAHAYLEFMEGENLTADGLLDAAEEAGMNFREAAQFEEYRRLFIHLDVSHDLWHVITGYGRDALGEVCNLIFTHTMTRNGGFPLIVTIGLLAQKLEAPGAPLLKAALEARRMSRGAAWLPGFDVEELLPMQLADVRRLLNVTEPEAYLAVPEALREQLLKPKVKQTQTEREARGDALA